MSTATTSIHVPTLLPTVGKADKNDAGVVSVVKPKENGRSKNLITVFNALYSKGPRSRAGNPVHAGSIPVRSFP